MPARSGPECLLLSKADTRYINREIAIQATGINDTLKSVPLVTGFIFFPVFNLLITPGIFKSKSSAMIRIVP